MTTEQLLRTGSGLSTVNARAAVNYQRSVIVSDEERQWIKEGRVFHGFEGVLTTPGTIAATDLVRQQPQLMIRVPATVVIVPLSVIWVPEATTAISQMLVSCCNNDPGVANMTAVTPVNVNTRFAANSSAVTCYGTSAGNTGTAPAGVADLYREYHQADRDAITGSPTPSLIYNPSAGKGQECAIGNDVGVNALLIYGVSGTTGTNTGFFIATWAEFTFDEWYS